MRSDPVWQNRVASRCGVESGYPPETPRLRFHRRPRTSLSEVQLACLPPCFALCRFVRAYRWYALLGVLAVLATTVADLVGPQILRRIIDQGIAKADYRVIFTGAAALVAVAVFGGFANFLSGLLLGEGEPRLGVRDAQRRSSTSCSG